MDWSHERPATEAGKRPRWFKSSYSTGACTCVEVRFDGDAVYVRDSKYLLDPRNDPAAQPTIAVPVNEWTLVLTDAVGDLPVVVNGAVDLLTDSEGALTMTCRSTGVSLTYDVDEIAAFRSGVIAGEFSLVLASPD